jgi:hypothetical protein
MENKVASEIEIKFDQLSFILIDKYSGGRSKPFKLDWLIYGDYDLEFESEETLPLKDFHVFKDDFNLQILLNTAPTTPQPDTSNAADILKDWKEGLEKFIESADVDSAPIELLNLEAYIWLRGNKTGRGIGAEWSKSFFIPIIERLRGDVEYYKRERDYHKEKQIEAELETEEIRKEIERLLANEKNANNLIDLKTDRIEKLQEEIRNYEASNTDGNTI